MFKTGANISKMMSRHLGGGSAVSRAPMFNTIAARKSPSVGFGPAAAPK